MQNKLMGSVFFGILGGLLMSIVLLYMLVGIGFVYSDMMFILCVICGISLPWCLMVLNKYEWINVWVSQVLMVVISFVIILIYGIFMQSSVDVDVNMFKLIMICDGLIHGLSLLPILMRRLFKK